MAKYCKFCGKELEEGKECICQTSSEQMENVSKVNKKAKIGENIGIPDETGRTKSYERGKQIVPDCISANEGEIPIRQYEIAKLRTVIKGAFAEGRLQVTNKRVLFRSSGFSLLGPNKLQYEFAIDEIAGIEIRKDHRLGVFHFLIALIVMAWTASVSGNMFGKFSEFSNFLAGLFALVLFIAAMFTCIAFKGKHYLKLIFLTFAGGALSVKAFTTRWLVIPVLTGGLYSLIEGICIVAMLLHLILIAFVPNLVLEIKTKGASSPIEIRRKESNGLLAFMFNMPKNEYTGYADVMPGKDTEKAMKELGALINDINLLGDKAIEKWEEK